MGILSGPEIIKQVQAGNIEIDPYNESKVRANSYDVCISDQILILEEDILDLKVTPKFRRVTIPKEGMLLFPGQGYLGCTVERIKTVGYVPWVDGRSTTGRFFLQMHQTAGRGDDGFDGSLTLEIIATYKPIRIYTNMELAQISFLPIVGRRQPYNGRYQNQSGPTPPKAFT